MKIRVTIKSGLLGLVVFIVFALQSFGKVSGGKWSETVGIVVALAGAALGLAIAVTATSPSVADKPPRQIRNLILQWIGFVVVFLLVFQLLDAFHVNWRQYLH